MTSFAASFENAGSISAYFNRVPAYKVDADLPVRGAKFRVELSSGGEYGSGLQTVVKYILVRQTGSYTLATGLDPKLTWSVRLWKVSENFNHGSWPRFNQGPEWWPPYENKPFLLQSSQGMVGFAGFDAPRGVKWLESQSPDFFSSDVRKLDFVGDSDTAGFCVDGPEHVDRATFDMVNATNAYQNWASRISRSFDAEMTIEAVSGWGITNSSKGPVQTVKDYMNGAVHERKWDYTKWVPDAVIILIGPNDWFNNISNSFCITSPDFTTAYTEFLQNITEAYKFAPKFPKLINICGGSGNGEARQKDGRRCCQHIQSACSSYNLTRPTWFIDMPLALHAKINNPPYQGCFEHYNPHGHRLLANFLLPEIGSILGWTKWQ